jgi:hypothetical protein
VCGGACCGLSEICFANACVSPGKTCYSERDCAGGEYCEPSLGPAKPDDVTPPKPGGVCLLPPPRPGRCLALPPQCSGDGSLPSPPPSGGVACVPACEYHPPKGHLDAVPKWQWGPVAKEYPSFTDVWSTPAVARIYDTNCDGQVNELDPPSVVFVSGDSQGTCCSCGDYVPSLCQTGVLRMLDGGSGKEIWSLAKASPDSTGFAGFSIAVGDMDNDGRLDIAAVTGEGYLVLVNAEGKVVRKSDQPIPPTGKGFGWGGALAIADMDGDGFPEIAYGATVFTTKGGGITLKFNGAGGNGPHPISTFVDLDGAPDGHLELLYGNTAFRSDGTELWHRSDLPEGFPGVGDVDMDGKPDVVLVAKAQVWVLRGATGETYLGPVELTGGGNGGPPTVADFDKDGKREIGVAMQTFYSVVKPDFAKKQLKLLWKTNNHDLSSSVTGSTVFDFEGDGEAEVIYGDECFLWVYDGKTGAVRFATPRSSFTATEASLVADVDGDGRAEMLWVANGASPTGWKCDIAPWNQPDPVLGRPAWTPPSYGPAYRGLILWGDPARGWVGTRSIWNQHTYHVSNICDPRDTACDGPNTYGSIPRREKKNWQVGWLNNFRQNVQDKGLFDAPDATVSLMAECKDPVILHAYVRNMGLALLPAGVEVGFYVKKNGATLLGKATTQAALFPGQVDEVILTTKASDGLSLRDEFFAGVLVDPKAPTFHECRGDNNLSSPRRPLCLD